MTNAPKETESRKAAHRVARDAFATGRISAGHRIVPEEVPIAFSFLGTTYAVMMASPTDLEDFATGFCLSEAIIKTPSDIERVDIVEVDQGIDLQIHLVTDLMKSFKATQRNVAGPAGCGLCGVESIDKAMRDLPVVTSGLSLIPADIEKAVTALSRAQHLNRETHAVHAAGLFVPGRGLVAAREDVGRHNALDKLAGSVARQQLDGASGAVVLTSRVSVEMVQKTARMGASVVIAVSAPTRLAIETAQSAGITLVAIARGAEFEIFTHPGRIASKGSTHVA